MRLDVTGRIVDVWFDKKLVTTQKFSSTGVLRGSFGLIMGLGEARFRNIRFLARPSRDPGARIERELRMEKLRKKAEVTGGSLDGSWLGQVPPWLESVEWVQNPRTGWDDKGTVPTILLFWTRKQNKLIPLNRWLKHLAEKYTDAGLEFVCVAAHDDGDGIEKYLKKRPFPGSVAVDRIRKKGYGETFELYSIPRFETPRLLLLDIDHKVLWEGDPGFKVGKKWKPGKESYLEPPLKDLIAARDLTTLYGWRKGWAGEGQAALQEGNLETALPYLLQARSLDRTLVPEVGDALERLERLENALGSLEALALNLVRNEREPAMGILLKWGDLLGKPVDSKTKRAINSTLKCKRARAWSQAMGFVEKCRKSMKPGKEPAAVSVLIKKLEPLEGPFLEELRGKLTGADDAAALLLVLDGAKDLPARWLARDYLRY